MRCGLQVISDLLKPERTTLVIREDRKRGVFVDGLSEWVVRSPQEVRLPRGVLPQTANEFCPEQIRLLKRTESQSIVKVHWITRAGVDL